MRLTQQQLGQIKGDIKENQSLAEYTSWRVGGVADYVYKPADLKDLAVFLAMISDDLPVVWLGLGSNVLVRDHGFRGVVIVTQGALNEIEFDDGCVCVQAGVTCAKLAKFVAKKGLVGGSFFAGIPGTVGGALAMNAGAFGDETWSNVLSVTMINRLGQLIERGVDEFDIDYRQVNYQGDMWFASARFGFKQGDVAEELDKIRQLLRKRNSLQPIGEHSCGSVFRNPPGNYAAQLIESSGLKGYRIGGAWVSEKHANFIINGADATADDIESLIQYVEQVVREKHGVELVREMHIIGE